MQPYQPAVSVVAVGNTITSPLPPLPTSPFFNLLPLHLPSPIYISCNSSPNPIHYKLS